MVMPRKYDRAKLVPDICRRMAEEGMPLAVICREFQIPVRTVDEWRETDPEIDKQFEAARKAGADLIAWSAIQRAHRAGKRGKDSHVEVLRDRLAVETDLKLLAKWDKRYAEKQEIEHTGKLTLEQLVAASQPKD